MKTNLSNPVKLILLLAALMMAGEILTAQSLTNLALNKTATTCSPDNTGMQASSALGQASRIRKYKSCSNEKISIVLFNTAGRLVYNSSATVSTCKECQ